MPTRNPSDPRVTSPPLQRDTIAARVERFERELRELDRTRADLEARLAEAREELARVDSRPAPPPPAPPRPSARLGPEQKIFLFRSVFRGREDVYPTRFVSKKTGKAGYSPVCSNKFVDGLCDLRRVKCTDCKHEVIRVASLDAEGVQYRRRKVPQVEGDDGLGARSNSSRQDVPVVRIRQRQPAYQARVP